MTLFNKSRSRYYGSDTLRAHLRGSKRNDRTCSPDPPCARSSRHECARVANPLEVQTSSDRTSAVRSQL
ncbi:unnamed protein product [Arctia plantaginis]|uniref:Uncharacterized protein n=1 Tax=Arctia plantaginis TaxID=874455 RepID=A0A8S1A7L1_ARCPL|nr:unnamed protein product [Arctia plantaginis]